jgi:hypothetical protein
MAGVRRRDKRDDHECDGGTEHCQARQQPAYLDALDRHSARGGTHIGAADAGD